MIIMELMTVYSPLLITFFPDCLCNVVNSPMCYFPVRVLGFKVLHGCVEQASPSHCTLNCIQCHGIADKINKLEPCGGDVMVDVSQVRREEGRFLVRNIVALFSQAVEPDLELIHDPGEARVATVHEAALGSVVVFTGGSAIGKMIKTYLGLLHIRGSLVNVLVDMGDGREGCCHPFKVLNCSLAQDLLTKDV